MTEIQSNGSKGYGEKPDGIDVLINMLKAHTLDPVFEAYGDFVNRNPQWLTKKLQGKYKGHAFIFGNFLNYSHVFNIITDDEQLIKEIEILISENKGSLLYRKARECRLKFSLKTRDEK